MPPDAPALKTIIRAAGSADEVPMRLKKKKKSVMLRAAVRDRSFNLVVLETALRANIVLFRQT